MIETSVAASSSTGPSQPHPTGHDVSQGWIPVKNKRNGKEKQDPPSKSQETAKHADDVPMTTPTTTTEPKLTSDTKSTAERQETETDQHDPSGDNTNVVIAPAPRILKKTIKWKTTTTDASPTSITDSNKTTATATVFGRSSNIAYNNHPSQDEKKQGNISLKEKRIIHGSNVTAPAEEKQREFTLTFNVKESLDDTATMVNLALKHKLFIKAFLDISEGDVHFLPTSKSDNKAQQPIINIGAYPNDEKGHRNFFHRSVTHHDATHNNTVRIHHLVLMKESVKDVKTKLISFLKQHSLWIGGGELNAIETVNVAWLHGAHPTMVNRIALEDKINAAARALPNLSSIRSQFLKDHEIDIELPRFFVQTRTIHCGSAPNKVSTTTLSLTCVKIFSRMMKEIASTIQESPDTPYIIIPTGFTQIADVTSYKQAMISNNDIQNSVQGISMIGLDPQWLDYEITCNDNETLTLQSYLTQGPFIATMEPTQYSDSHGRFIFIVYKNQFQKAREFLSTFCATDFYDIIPDEQERHDYRARIGSLPHLYEAAPLGGAVKSRIDSIVASLGKIKTTTGSAPPSSTAAWSNKSRPKFVFSIEDAEAFPDLSEKTKEKSNTTATSVTTHGSDGDNITGNHLNSSSKSLASTDISTVVSEMKSFMTETTREMRSMMSQQSENNQKMMTQQAETTQKMMSDMMRQNQAANTQMISTIMESMTKMITASGPPQYTHPMPPQHYYPSHPQGFPTMGSGHPPTRPSQPLQHSSLQIPLPANDRAASSIANPVTQPTQTEAMQIDQPPQTTIGKWPPQQSSHRFPHPPSRPRGPRAPRVSPDAPTTTSKKSPPTSSTSSIQSKRPTAPSPTPSPHGTPVKKPAKKQNTSGTPTRHKPKDELIDYDECSSDHDEVMQGTHLNFDEPIHPASTATASLPPIAPDHRQIQ
jgi:hypothetical protein